MRILSVRDGFAPDHSTQTYRYTAPDKGTAWRAFWKGLSVVCAAGQVQDLTLFSPDPLAELDLHPRPIHRFLFVEEGEEPPHHLGGSLTFDEWRTLIDEYRRELSYAFLAPGYGAGGILSLSPRHLLINDYLEYRTNGVRALQRLDPWRLKPFEEYEGYDEGEWSLFLRKPVPGTYTIEAGVERRTSRRWHILEFEGVVDSRVAEKELTPWMEGSGFQRDDRSRAHLFRL